MDFNKSFWDPAWALSEPYVSSLLSPAPLSLKVTSTSIIAFLAFMSYTASDCSVKIFPKQKPTCKLTPAGIWVAKNVW